MYLCEVFMCFDKVVPSKSGNVRLMQLLEFFYEAFDFNVLEVWS